VRGNKRLAETDAAIAGGHLSMKINFKILFAERGEQ
jgi:hypothetical protein